MKRVIIEIKDGNTVQACKLKIWQMTIIERLLKILVLAGVKNPCFLIHQDIQLTEAAFFDRWINKNMIVRMPEKNDLILPANLVCSQLFIRQLMTSQASFAEFCKTSKRVFAICYNDHDIGRIKKDLFRDAKKDSDGFVSKKINAKISIPLSYILSFLPLPPNIITLFNIPIVLLALYFVVQTEWLCSAYAGLLFQFASIFDGCDGEIARTQLRETHFGGWLDTLVDNLSYLSFFFGIGIWQTADKGNPFYLYIMIVTLFVLMISLGLTYIGMNKLKTSTHHAYRHALLNTLPHGLFSKIVSITANLSKREYFALSIMFLCLCNLRCIVYILIVSGIVIYSFFVMATFFRVLKNAKLKKFERINNV